VRRRARAPIGRLLSLALERYGVPEQATVEFIRHGENETYRVEAPGGPIALRLARSGYHTVGAVRSEVAWMSALREYGIHTPPAVRGLDGEAVQEIPLPDGSTRVAVAFDWVQGNPLTEVENPGAWVQLGEIIARVHGHGTRWNRPVGFERPAWDEETLVGDAPRWGNPCPDGIWPEPQLHLILKAREVVRERMAQFGKAPERFGLIHADLGFENVLIGPDGQTVLLDFDDSGPSWFLYEFASVLYPYGHTERLSELLGALVEGYQRVRPMSDHDLGELPTFLMARRLATLGWTFSRAGTAHARRQRMIRLQTSPLAAQRFLEWASLAR
jgi:Ser/Thr protein kinase RdoA (MazF antagonist)